MTTLSLSNLLTAGATLNGAAQPFNTTLRLTTDVSNQTSSAFYNTPISVGPSFQTQFQFQITGEEGTNGADGIVFLLQNSDLGPAALGTDGGSLGYLEGASAGVTPALAVEFDTFQNGFTDDIGANTVEVITYDATGSRQILAQQVPSFDINDGGVYTAWIDYTAVDNGPDTLQVFAAAGTDKPAQPLIVQDIELPALLGNQAYVGFSSATGSIRNIHDLLGWSFNQADTPTASTGYFNFEQFTQAALFDAGLEIPYTPVEFNGLAFDLLYDETYYLCQNPDVAAAVEQGIFQTGYDHFTQFGWLEGRNPSLLFDEAYYLAQNPDVAAEKASRLISSGFQHYVFFGQEEGRDPSALFDEAAYLAANADVQEAVNQGIFQSGFDHYIEYGAPEGRGPNLILFEENYYLAQNPDVAAAIASDQIASALAHYASLGQQEQRDPSRLFDESAYLAANPDVAAAVSAGGLSSGFQHYILDGRCEGRTAIPVAEALV